MGVLTFGPMLPSSVAQSVKNLSVVQETRVPSLGWEDPLEEEMATHSSILAWKIPWTEEPGQLQSMGWQRVRQDLATKPLALYDRKIFVSGNIPDRPVNDLFA